MDIEVKERLINVVRENECIYNHKHEDYKNNSLKIQLWENIGAELNIEANEAKQMWRTLRDGYTRHHKQVKWQKLTSRKYAHYMWSAHMTFLDATLDSRAVEPGSPKLSITSGFQPQPESSQIYPKTPIASLSSSVFKRRDPDSNQDHLTKKKREDGIDLLFMSYAATFKRLSVRKQAELKVVLAKMFAEAELSELMENDTNEDQDSAPNTFYFSTDKLSEDGIKKEDISLHSSE